MERIFDVITDRRGNALASAQVTVKTEAGSVATIFSDDGVTTAVNPTFTNADGEFTFFIANGKFTTEVVATGYSTEIVNHKVAFDPADHAFTNIADVFDTYAGRTGLPVSVNSAGTGLTAVAQTFTSLADTFSSYSGKGGLSLQVNAGATGITAVTATSAGTFTALSDTFSTYSGKGGYTLQVNAGATGVTAVASVAGSTQGRHGIWIAAGSMRQSVSGGCQAIIAVVTTANQPDVNSLDFDTTTQEYAQFSMLMPKSWDEGTITFVPVWSHAATTTNFGVVWSLQAYAASNDDAIAAAYGTVQTSTDTGGTTNDIYMGPESSAITISGTPAAEDLVFFRISRVTADGSDTMAIDARLHGAMVYITTNADTDA